VARRQPVHIAKDGAAKDGASAPRELATLRRTARPAGTFVLMAKDQSPLFQIVGRHLYRHTVPGKCFDPILFHFSGRVGNELMSIVKLNAVTRIGQYLGHKTLELQQFFLGHVIFLIKDRPTPNARTIAP
jgi:hypothetical protein